MIEPADDLHRAYSECGAECAPEPFETDQGIRIAFSCLRRGVHTVIDPFEGSR